MEESSYQDEGKQNEIINTITERYVMPVIDTANDHNQSN